MKPKEPRPFFTPHKKINTKEIINLKVWAKTVKLTKEKHETIIYDLNAEKCFRKNAKSVNV